MEKKQRSVTTHKTFMSMSLASLTIFLAIAVSAFPQEENDWKQWSAKDINLVLSKSAWVSRCCRDWDTMTAADAAGADPGFTAVIVSSRRVREALVRHRQLDKRYERLDSESRLQVEQRMGACLNEEFDADIIISFSFLGNPGLDLDKSYLSRIYLITSDGRKIPGHQVPASVAMTCGAFPQDSDLISLGNGSSWPPLGPRKEVAFPRIVDGKSTISAKDTTIRVDSGFRGRQPASYSEFDFSVAKLVYQGKPDF